MTDLQTMVNDLNDDDKVDKRVIAILQQLLIENLYLQQSLKEESNRHVVSYHDKEPNY